MDTCEHVWQVQFKAMACRVADAAVGRLAVPGHLDGDLAMVALISDARTMARALIRLCGIRELDGTRSPSAPFCREVKRKIHLAFGAPGDWGYDTPLGDAMNKLYDFSIPSEANTPNPGA